MKVIPLRELVREPLKVKRWTRAGQAVQVTDRGTPLWIIQAAEPETEPKNLPAEIDDILDGVLSEKRREQTLSQTLEESRR